MARILIVLGTQEHYTILKSFPGEQMRDAIIYGARVFARLVAGDSISEVAREEWANDPFEPGEKFATIMMKSKDHREELFTESDYLQARQKVNSINRIKVLMN